MAISDSEVKGPKGTASLNEDSGTTHNMFCHGFNNVTRLSTATSAYIDNIFINYHTQFIYLNSVKLHVYICLWMFLSILNGTAIAYTLHKNIQSYTQCVKNRESQLIFYNIAWHHPHHYYCLCVFSTINYNWNFQIKNFLNISLLFLFIMD